MSFTIKIKLLIALAVIAAGAYSYSTIAKLKTENFALRNNQEVLLSSTSDALSALQIYKVRDSLNAAKISALLLTIDDYERYRVADAKLISKLRIDKEDLQRVVGAQIETINSLNLALRDTIIITDSTKIKVQNFEYKSNWTDVSGIITKDSIALSIVNREALQIVETVKYKRFLGFLWKTNRVKSRDLDIISKNPNTSIVSVDYIQIVE